MAEKTSKIGLENVKKPKKTSEMVEKTPKRAGETSKNSRKKTSKIVEKNA